ncbi:MAG: RNA methyltransferase [Lachnospiraceae bacterium]|nr:RNA methyltransferase [Lachnospiraceae bacterium]
MNNIIEITDFNAPELDIYARLTENQLLNRHEPDKGIFIAESPKVIERALDAGCEPISILIEKKHIETQGKDILERCGDIPIYTAEFDVLTQLTGFKLTRGMLCAMKRPLLPSIEEVCKDKNRIVILENVMNPTNVGAIFRSAAALNMDAVLLTSGCSNPLYRRSIRVSMGTVFQIPWTFIENDNYDTFDVSIIPETNNVPSSYIDEIKALGFKTAAMALDDNSVSIDDSVLNSEEKLAIILGTEGDGLATSTIADCDYTVKIPMAHGVDSLNVAAASAVAFWQLGKK